VIAVFGGYGVFGALVSRELAQMGATVTVIGRDLDRAQALAGTLGRGHVARRVDVTDARAVRDALADHRVAVHCAGPFTRQEPVLLEACLETGCHYVDIADDRDYVRRVRAHHGRAIERAVTIAYGCSSLPGLSGALAVVACADGPVPDRVRATLFIGNDNAKSATAIRSLVFGLGHPIEAPQGYLHGFCERERVMLPAPFGARVAYAFESPDYDVLAAAVGARAITVLVGFENRLAGPMFALLARLGPRWGERTTRVLAQIGRWDRSGHSGGVVRVDLFGPGARQRYAMLHAAKGGQRLAALPAALVALALATGTIVKPGAWTAYDVLGAERLVSQVAAAGFERAP
jgi:hypothetical protein